MKDVRAPLLTVLFIFLGLLLYTKVFGPIPFSVNSISTTKTSNFSVQGTGEVTAVPDTALINLGVSKTSSTVDEAQNQVNAIINKLTTDIKNLGIDTKDIKTVNYSVNPNYDYTAGSQKINGYEVRADIQVKIKPLDKANAAIDAATKDGATNVGNVQFTINDDKRKELETQARKEAIDEAKQKAQSISQASGIHLGRIIDVQEGGAGVIQPQPMFNALSKDAAGSAAPATELNPGENKITSNVTLSYETY
jgi:uncharacterized protein YggE